MRSCLSNFFQTLKDIIPRNTSSPTKSNEAKQKKAQDFKKKKALQELAEISPAPSDALSLIVPMAKRYEEVKALLGYFSEKRLKYKILLLISGKAPAELNAFQSLDIKKIEFDEKARLVEKIKVGLAEITTPTVAMLADHDIVTSEGLAKAAGFLLKNRDYAACQGYHSRLDFHNGERILMDVPWFTPSLEDQNSINRLSSLIRRYQPVCWATFRTKVMNEVINQISNINSLFFYELTWSCTTVIMGKVKRLPMIYCLRRSHATHLLGHPLYAWLESPDEFLAQYKKYREGLIVQLQRQSSLPPAALARLLDLIHGCYFGREIDTGIINFFAECVLKDPTASILDQNIKEKIQPIVPTSEIMRREQGRKGGSYQILKNFLEPQPAEEIPLDEGFVDRTINELESYQLDIAKNN